MNWLAIVFAALSTLAVGFVWYHPKVFGTIWMKASGVDPEGGKNSNMLLIFGIVFVAAGVAAFQMSYSVHEDEKFAPFIHGMYHGMRVSLFYIAPAVVINALFERRSAVYMAVHIGYWLASFCTMGGILYSMN
jgi:hypothetical protein